MSDLPPEIAVARKLLRELAPLEGSNKRVYQKVVAARVRGKRVAMRTAVVGVCLAASTSAMAFGYRWVTNRVPTTSPVVASSLSSSRVAPVPRRPKRQGNTAERLATKDPDGSALSESASAVSNSQNPRGLVPQAAASSSSKRMVLAPDQASSAAVSNARAPEASELSQQVREYHEAVAPMRSNPHLALLRLQAHRSKWPRSAISEEVDLREIEAFLVLGRRHEAASAAARFIRRYPGSARAAEIQRLAGEASRTGVFED